MPGKQRLFSLETLASLADTAPLVWLDVSCLTGCHGNGSVLTELEQRAALPLLPMGKVDSPWCLGKLPCVGKGAWVSTDLGKKVTLVSGLLHFLHPYDASPLPSYLPLQELQVCVQIMLAAHCNLLEIQTKMNCCSGEKNSDKRSIFILPLSFISFLFLSCETQPFPPWKVPSLSSLSLFRISRT